MIRESVIKYNEKNSFTYFKIVDEYNFIWIPNNRQWHHHRLFRSLNYSLHWLFVSIIVCHGESVFHPSLLFFVKRAKALMGNSRLNASLIRSEHARQLSCRKLFHVQFILQTISHGIVSISLEYQKFLALSFAKLQKSYRALFGWFPVCLLSSYVFYVDHRERFHGNL